MSKKQPPEQTLIEPPDSVIPQLEIKLPTVSEPFVAFRHYSIKSGLLTGGYAHSWLGREARAICGDAPLKDGGMVAQSSVDKARKHLASNACACGIYAYRDKTTHWTREPGTVIAKCLLWGIVIPAELGFRAEACRIESLELVVDETTPPEWRTGYLELLRERYGVPVSVLDVTKDRNDAKPLSSLAGLTPAQHMVALQTQLAQQQINSIPTYYLGASPMPYTYVEPSPKYLPAVEEED